MTRKCAQVCWLNGVIKGLTRMLKWLGVVFHGIVRICGLLKSLELFKWWDASHRVKSYHMFSGLSHPPAGIGLFQAWTIRKICRGFGTGRSWRNLENIVRVFRSSGTWRILGNVVHRFPPQGPEGFLRKYRIPVIFPGLGKSYAWDMDIPIPPPHHHTHTHTPSAGSHCRSH